MSRSGVHEHPNPGADDSHGEGSEVVHLAHGDHAVDGVGHGPADAHGHGAPSEPLGPVDSGSWAAAIGGSALAIVVVIALYLAISAA